MARAWYELTPSGALYEIVVTDDDYETRNELD
jgi:hypothetical protein